MSAIRSAFSPSSRILLKDDGVIIIDTPNIDCGQARLFGKDWGGIHAPRHWVLFDLGTLRETARRAGLKTLEIEQLPINTFWIWSMHSYLYRRPRWRTFADRWFDPIACVSSPSLYYFGLMVFAELLERASKVLGLGVGQQRAIFARK